MDFLQGLKIEEIPLPPMRTVEVQPAPDDQLCSGQQPTRHQEHPKLNELNCYGSTDFVASSISEGKRVPECPPPRARISPEAGDEGAQEATTLATENLLNEQRRFPEPDTNEWIANAFYIVNGAVSKAITTVQEAEGQEDDVSPKELKRGSGTFSGVDLDLLQKLYPGVDENVIDPGEEIDEVFSTPSRNNEDDIVIDFTRIKSGGYSSPESVEQSYYSLEANLSTRDDQQDFEDCTVLEVKHTDINANELVTDIDDYDVLKEMESSTPCKKFDTAAQVESTPYRIPKIVIDSESETEVQGSFVENTPTNVTKERMPDANESSTSIENMLSQVKLSETPNDPSRKTEIEEAQESELDDSYLKSPSKPVTEKSKSDVSCSSFDKSYSDTFTGASEISETSSASSEESSETSTASSQESFTSSVQTDEDCDEEVGEIDDADNSLDFSQSANTHEEQATPTDVHIVVEDVTESSQQETAASKNDSQKVHQSFASQDSVTSLTSPVSEPTPIGALSHKMCAGKWDLTQLSMDSEDGSQQSREKREVFKRQSAISQQSSTDFEGSEDKVPVVSSASTSETSGFQSSSLAFSTSADSELQCRSLSAEEEEALKLLNFDEFSSGTPTPSASNTTIGEKEGTPLMAKYKKSVEDTRTPEVQKLQKPYSHASYVPRSYSVDPDDNIMEGEDLGNGNMITEIDAYFAADVAPNYESSPELAPQTFSVNDFDNPLEAKPGSFHLFDYDYQPPCEDEGFTNPLFDNIAAEVEIEAQNVRYVKPQYQEGMLTFGNLAYEGDEEENDHRAKAESAVDDSHVDEVVYDGDVYGDEPAPYDGCPDDTVEEYVDGIIQAAIKELKEHPNSAGKRGRMRRNRSAKGSRSPGGCPGCGGNGPCAGCGDQGCGDGCSPMMGGSSAPGQPAKSKCCCTII